MFLKTKITFLDCDKENPSKIFYIHNKPLLSLGQPGTFDEHGTMMSEIVFYQNKYWLYYLGWQRSTIVPYITTLGLALSNDGINFEKVSEGPVIGLNRFSPFGVAKTSILVEDNTFKMWYTHYNSWYKNTLHNEFSPDKIEYRPTYDIRYAESKNGLDWTFKEEVCISPIHDNEALGAPCVKKIDNKIFIIGGFINDDKLINEVDRITKENKISNRIPIIKCCPKCLNEFSALRKERIYCSKSCAASVAATKVKNNGMKNIIIRQKFSDQVTGRKRKYNTDGSWSWYYPEKNKEPH